MSTILFPDDEECQGKINIDDLFERKQRRDLKQIAIFDKILNRIHRRITQTGRNKLNEKHVWFTVPEYIFGEPNYDQGECIGYLVSRLETNGFHIRYIHPNTLFVSWEHWVPAYVRSEFKKKTGLILDERGHVIDKRDPGEEVATDDLNANLFNDPRNGQQQPGAQKKEYTSIKSYKPTGNLVYHPDMFEKIEKRVT